MHVLTNVFVFCASIHYITPVSCLKHYIIN